MCKHAVKKLRFVIRYVPDQYKTQQTCDKAIDNYPHALKFVPYCCMTQEMCDKAGNRRFL